MPNSLTVRPAFCIALCLSVFLVPIRWVLAWFLAAVIHELGHLIALRMYKIPVLRITCDLPGAQIETGYMQPAAEFICALFGPLFGFICLFLSRYAPYLAICSFIQSIYNLLPFQGLDGERALRAGLSFLFLQDKADKLLKWIRYMTALLLLILGFRLWLIKDLGFAAFELIIFPLLKVLIVKIPCKQPKQIVQ